MLLTRSLPRFSRLRAVDRYATPSLYSLSRCWCCVDSLQSSYFFVGIASIFGWMYKRVPCLQFHCPGDGDSKSITGDSNGNRDHHLSFRLLRRVWGRTDVSLPERQVPYLSDTETLLAVLCIRRANRKRGNPQRKYTSLAMLLHHSIYLHGPRHIFVDKKRFVARARCCSISDDQAPPPPPFSPGTAASR